LKNFKKKKKEKKEVNYINIYENYKNKIDNLSKKIFIPEEKSIKTVSQQIGNLDFLDLSFKKSLENQIFHISKEFEILKKKTKNNISEEEFLIIQNKAHNIKTNKIFTKEIDYKKNSLNKNNLQKLKK
jgi:hypothetical protein